MADLSQIKVGNVVYDIKDSVARETALQGGGSLDFKTSYLHVFEFWETNSSPQICYYVYVPMTTKELQGENFLKLEMVECSWWDVSALVKNGAFVVATINVYGNGSTYYFCELDVEETYFDEVNTVGQYSLVIRNSDLPPVPISMLTFVSEKVI